MMRWRGKKQEFEGEQFEEQKGEETEIDWSNSRS